MTARAAFWMAAFALYAHWSDKVGDRGASTLVEFIVATAVVTTYAVIAYGMAWIGTPK